MNSSQGPRDVLLMQPPFGTQRDPAYREAALFTNGLRARFRLSRREPAVLDVRLIDERGQNRSPDGLSERELTDLERAFRDQMNAFRNPDREKWTRTDGPNGSDPGGESIVPVHGTVSTARNRR